MLLQSVIQFTFNEKKKYNDHSITVQCVQPKWPTYKSRVFRAHVYGFQFLLTTKQFSSTYREMQAKTNEPKATNTFCFVEGPGAKIVRPFRQVVRFAANMWQNGKQRSSTKSDTKLSGCCRSILSSCCHERPNVSELLAPVPFGHGYGLWYCVVLPCPSTQQTVALDGLWRQPTTNQLTPYLIKNCTVLLWPQVTWARPESPARCIASPRTLYVVVLHFFTHCPLVGISYRGVRAYEEWVLIKIYDNIISIERQRGRESVRSQLIFGEK